MKYLSLLLLSVSIVLCSGNRGDNAGAEASEAGIQSGKNGFQGCKETRKVKIEKLVEKEGRLYTLYYDHDRLDIRDECKALLARNTEWMNAHPGVMITIEGHTDASGTSEYNLALGARMTDRIAKYLKEHGVSRNRYITVSLGGERPADAGHNKIAWARNRRIEFVISK